MISTAACCQESHRDKLKRNMHKLHLRQKQLDLEEREAKLDFQRETRKIKLQKQRIGLERGRKKNMHPGRFKHCKPKKCAFLALCFIINIFLAVWVYQDIRKRNAGSGMWIVITLLAGFFGALLYTIVRLGDIRKA
jgi:hypothetical protein